MIPVNQILKKAANIPKNIFEILGNCFARFWLLAGVGTNSTEKSILLFTEVGTTGITSTVNFKNFMEGARNLNLFKVVEESMIVPLKRAHT